MNRSLVTWCFVIVQLCAAVAFVCHAAEQRATNFNCQAVSVCPAPKPLTSTDNRKLWLICDSNADITLRLAAARDLGSALKTADIRALYDFLKAHPDKSEANLAGLRFLKNEVFGTLLDQTVPPQGLAEAMIAVWADHEQDIVVRDYAIQHMTVWYDDNPERKDTDRSLIRAVLMQAAQEQSSVAGTALIGLHHLSAFDYDINGRTIDDIAFQMAASVSMPDTARITAVQICAERHVVAAVSVIEQILAESQNTTLRLSARSALNALRISKEVEPLHQSGVYVDIQHSAISDGSTRQRDYRPQEPTSF